MQALTKIVFARDEFSSPVEEQIARIFNPEQSKNIKNLLLELINQKLGMPSHEEAFLLKQEYFRGQIDILYDLINVSEYTKGEMRLTPARN